MPEQGNENRAPFFEWLRRGRMRGLRDRPTGRTAAFLRPKAWNGGSRGPRCSTHLWGWYWRIGRLRA